MSLEWTKISTPNARVIYQEFPLPVQDWVKAPMVLDQHLQQFPRVQLANPFFYLYFFAPTLEENFSQLDYWIAREVIGPLTEEQLPEELGLTDLDRASAFQVPLVFSEETRWEEVFCQEALARTTIGAESRKELADTWRLQLRLAQGGASTALPEAFLQFFPLDEAEEWV